MNNAWSKQYKVAGVNWFWVVNEISFEWLSSQLLKHTKFGASGISLMKFLVLNKFAIFLQPSQLNCFCLWLPLYWYYFFWILHIYHSFQAVGLLKEGGVLVYSTCTLTPQENEQQVAWALKSFPCLRLERQVSNKSMLKTVWIRSNGKINCKVVVLLV